MIWNPDCPGEPCGCPGTEVGTPPPAEECGHPIDSVDGDGVCTDCGAQL